MNQKNATELGYELLKKSPLSDEARGYVEASLPYIVQRFYLAGYEITPAKTVLKAGDSISKADLERMLREGVIY